MSDSPTDTGLTWPPAEPSSGAPAGPDATSDEALLLGARARDEAALGMLFDRYGGLVYTLALRIVGDRDLAEEVTHDALIRCWNGAGQYDPARGTLAGWLLSATRRQAIAVLRGRPRWSHGDNGEPAGASSGRESKTIANAAEYGPRSSVGQALAELPEAQRAAVELAYYEGLTQSEAAQQLGEAPETVKVRIRDGLRRMRRELGPAADAGTPPGRGTS